MTMFASGHHLAPGRGKRKIQVNLTADTKASPLISCIMATRGHAFPARFAIECYRNQRYPNCELIIVCATPSSEVRTLVDSLAAPDIRMFEAPQATNVGDLRNHAIAQARGELVCIWDDDDLCHPERLIWQYAALDHMDVQACMLSQITLWWPAKARIALSPRRAWENTLLAATHLIPPYPPRIRGGDTEMAKALLRRNAAVLLEIPDAYLYVTHGGNLWGEDHFEMLFQAGQEIKADAGSAHVRRLNETMPLDAYCGFR